MGFKKFPFFLALFLVAGDFSFAGFQSTDSPAYSTPKGRTGLGTFSAAETIRVTATIASLFDLSVDVVGGGDALDFGVIGIGENPSRKELVVGMRTNLRRRYQIVQEVFGPLRNDKGDEIPQDRFTCVTYGYTGNRTKGELGAKEPTPLGEKPLILFLSDFEGNGDYFTVGYDVVPLKEQSAGQYSTVLTFTATLL